MYCYSINRIVIKITFLLLISTFIISCSSNRIQIDLKVKESNLVNHVKILTSTPEPRNYQNINSLNIVANYIDSIFHLYNNRVKIQTFKVNGIEYKNIICSFGPVEGKRIIVGAHYDVCQEQAGADDNASGISGLLEIARMLAENKPDLKSRIDLVAYSLEEPPFFGTDSMGSAIHAQSITVVDIDVKVMICLEMIGYFTDEPNSQNFPVGILDWFYPNTGNFILLVSNFKSHFIADKIQGLMKDNSSINVRQLTAPSSVAGVDFSDHRNYWKRGYKAVMITDTAFYRNGNYHKETDTIETLDFKRMAEVVNGTYAAIVSM